MPTLKWIGKDKIINYHNEVPFRLLKENKNLSVNSNDTENLLIKGDNLEALKALLPYYYNRIRAIYIDPPYNTGNENWIYNDNVNAPQIKKWLGKVVGGEADDLSRHDKWLCMMMPRLKLLRELLEDKGVIFISIGEDEVANLRCLMDEVYGEENFVDIVARVMKTASNKGTFFAPSIDFILCYAKGIEALPEFYDEVNESLYKKAEKDGPRKGERYRDDVALYQSSLDPLRGCNNQRYFIRAPDGSLLIPLGNTFPQEKSDGAYIPPQTKEDKVWRWTYETYFRNKELLIFKKTKTSPLLDENGQQAKWNIYVKSYLRDRSEQGTKPRNYLDKFINRKAADYLKVLGIDFAYSKPKELIYYLLKILKTNKDDIILDSFAGSGTTAEAVLRLNHEDSGHRRFVLVEMENGIAENITAERLRRLIQGYSYRKGDGKEVKVEGLGGGFKFLELDNPLFDKYKQISGEPPYEDLAGYIYFTETHSTIDWGKANRDDWYLGESNGVHYFIVYDSKSELAEEFLEIAKRYQGKKVVYADAVMIDDDELERFDIVFKQIPYEIKTF